MRTLGEILWGDESDPNIKDPSIEPDGMNFNCLVICCSVSCEPPPDPSCQIGCI